MFESCSLDPKKTCAIAHTFLWKLDPSKCLETFCSGSKNKFKMPWNSINCTSFWAREQSCIFWIILQVENLKKLELYFYRRIFRREMCVSNLIYIYSIHFFFPFSGPLSDPLGLFKDMWEPSHAWKSNEIQQKEKQLKIEGSTWTWLITPH